MVRRLAGVVLAAQMLLSSTGCKKNQLSPKPAVIYSKIDPATAGAIEGVIRFPEEVPPQVEIDMAQDPECAMNSLGKNYSEEYVVHDHKMANVFVYVKAGLGTRVYAPPADPVVLDQKGCRYTPHVIGVMAGQLVEFRNNDPTTHNINMQPVVAGDPFFNADQASKGAPVRHTFSQPETMIPVRCNYHPWMEAYVNVVANPFYTVSDNQGRYEIDGLPPGTYTLVAEQEKLGSMTQTVIVASRRTVQADFTF